jgi:hypothetical protein
LTIKDSLSALPIFLNVQKVNTQVVLKWAGAAFHLQSAPAVTGTFSIISGATGSYTKNSTGPRRYFGLISH